MINDLERLLAIDEIRELQARYARYADEKRWTDLASLFTEDATFTSLDTEGDTLAQMSGPSEIESTLSEVGSGEVTLIHQLFTAEIEVETPSTAKAVWAMADLIFKADTGGSSGGADLPDFTRMRGWGHYHNEYAKVDRGWLIANSRQTRTRLEFE